MSYLVDTNVISALRRKDRAAPSVLEWFKDNAGAEFFVSVLTLMEIEIGVRSLERVDQRQGAVLRAWKDGPVRTQFQGRCLSIDDEIAECCAALQVPDPRPANDALIASTAIVRRLTLVTRNEQDFKGMPVAILNPWRSADL